MISPVRAVLMELSMKTTKYCSVTNVTFQCISLAMESTRYQKKTGKQRIYETWIHRYIDTFQIGIHPYPSSAQTNTFIVSLLLLGSATYVHWV